MQYDQLPTSSGAHVLFYIRKASQRLKGRTQSVRQRACCNNTPEDSTDQITHFSDICGIIKMINLELKISNMCDVIQIKDKWSNKEKSKYFCFLGFSFIGPFISQLFTYLHPFLVFWKPVCCPICATLFVSSYFCTMRSCDVMMHMAVRLMNNHLSNRRFLFFSFFFRRNWLDCAKWNFYLKAVLECGWGTCCLADSAVDAESKC